MPGRMTPALRRLLIAALVVIVAAAAGVGWYLHSGTGGSRLFVANYKDDTVSVIDLEREREEKVLSVPDSPFAVTLCAGPSPSVVVTNSTAHRVTFVDPATLEIVATAPVSKGPEFAVCSPDGTRLYVTSPYDKTISVIDVAAHAPARQAIALDKKPGALAISLDGTRLYVAMRDDPGAVLALNTTTGSVEASAPVGKFPSDLALSGDGSRLVVASFDDNTITVIDPVTFKVLETYPLATGNGLVLHPTKPLVYSMDGFNDTIAVLDYQSGQELPSIECGKGPTYSAITADGRFLYVVNEESSNVAKIDTETGKQLVRIAVGDQPVDAVLFEPRR